MNRHNGAIISHLGERPAHVANAAHEEGRAIIRGWRRFSIALQARRDALSDLRWRNAEPLGGAPHIAQFRQFLDHAIVPYRGRRSSGAICARGSS